MVEEITPIINLHSSGKSYGGARLNYKYDGQRYLEFNLTMKKFKPGMKVGSDLWVLFSVLRDEFEFEDIAEIHISDDKRTTVMHCNYFLMCDTVVEKDYLNVDDYRIDIEMLMIRLYEKDSA